jgi:hypothetical protein
MQRLAMATLARSAVRRVFACQLVMQIDAGSMGFAPCPKLVFGKYWPGGGGVATRGLVDALNRSRNTLISLAVCLEKHPPNVRGCLVDSVDEKLGRQKIRGKQVWVCGFARALVASLQAFFLLSFQ